MPTFVLDEDSETIENVLAYHAPVHLSKCRSG